MTGGKFKLPKGYRECLDGAREEAGKFGIGVDYRIIGQHHPKLIFSYGDKELVVPFSCTPRVNMQAEFGKRKARQAARKLSPDHSPTKGCLRHE